MKIAFIGIYLLPSVSNAALVIDNFGSGELALSAPGSVIQESLNASSAASGRRGVMVDTLGSQPLECHINTTTGEFDFRSADFGYFTLTYNFSPGTEIDLLGNGGSAFVLDFSDVSPGLWRGIYEIKADGISVSFAQELFGLNGSGQIQIPISKFTSNETFAPTTIEISGARVEPDHRIALTSITVVPEPAILSMVIPGLGLLIRRRRV